jgi:tetratricopeptide (TPR) repeat protein
VVHDEQAGAGHGLAAALRELLGLGGLEPKPLRKRLQSQFDKDSGVDVEVLTSWLSSGGGSADAPERFQAAAEVLRNRSAERPVVLFIDDAPWGFEAVRFVRFLFEQQTDRTLPVLVVFTSRDEALGERSEVAALLKELDEKNEMITHALKPLGREDAAALVDDLLGLTVDLRQQVVERSGGNPLFAVQLLSDWVARGALAVGPEGFVLRAGEAANIPPDIERLCARRLEDLLARHSAEERRALVLAATLGIEVDDEEWLATCEVTQLPSPTNLRSDLFRAGLAVPEEGGWRFVHGMIHESLLVGVLSAEEHRQAHAVCAKMLAVGSSGESANLEERIARHWGRAGQPERAVEAFERAFLRRRVTAELRSIAGSLPDWGDAVAQLPAATAGPAHGILHWGHSIIAHHRGQPGRAVSLAARAIELSGDAPRDIRVSMRLSMARSEEESGAIQASHATATAALALAGDDPLLGARCHLQIAWAAMRLGETEKAEAALELAGQMSELADDLVIRITVLRRLGVIAQRSKDHRRAIDLLSAALQQLRPKKIPMIETSLCNDIAECYRLQGDYAQAEVFYSRSAASANRSGYLVLKQMVTLNRLLMRLAEHEYRSVAAELRTMGEWIAQYGSHLHEAMWQAMSLLCAATGEAPEAAEVHLRALEQQLADQGLVEYDLADLLLRSVPHLRSGNAWKLADRALELAAHQFTCLGDKDDLARVEVLRPSAG